MRNKRIIIISSVILAIAACFVTVLAIVLNNKKDANPQSPQGYDKPYNNPDVPMILLSDYTLTMDVMDEYKIIGSLVNVEGSIEWSCDNLAVAEVVNGLISTKAEGTAVITAKFNDILKTCILTVKDSLAMPVINIQSELFIFESDDCIIPFLVTFKGILVDAELTWECDKDSVAKVEDDGTVNGVASGTATITLIANYRGKTTQKQIYVTVMPEV